jgi:hypothetical protein
MDLQTHFFLGALHDDSAYGATANPGIGILARKDDFLGGAGLWRNSLKENAPYGFVGWQPFSAGNMRLGGIIGATSYRDKGQPIGGLFGSYRTGDSDWHLLATPKVKNKAPATLMLSYSKDF